ncbi:hypothetical protein SteCoe_15924 [Stentor coeruleus]|uniref:Enoyl reductase (ER) domain-containing protein n=1 Tax=Stentor coeruleus TaxID=5963 RepID=A0A1R2C2G0_9CILI|nr:hypothetical protein SteCoe_15924 [Stentor coeruleus]
MNKRVILKQRPDGIPKKEDFEVRVDALQLPLKQGEILVKVEWISADPAQLVWISGVKSYMPPVRIGDTVRALGVGLIVNSHAAGFKVGTYVSGLLGWQEYCKVHVSKIERIPKNVNPSLFLGIFGITGLTSYVAIKVLGKVAKKQVVVISTAAGAVGSVAVQIAKKQVVVISTAAGAVGSVAVQIAKAEGCKVIGITGTASKVQWLKDIGISEVINYKTDNVASSLKTLCPEGIDLYLDNVGGEMLDAVLLNAKKGARMILCGAIQSYGQKKAQPLYMYPLVISKSLKMKGFIVTDYQNKFEEGLKYLGSLYEKGNLKYKEDVVDGLENAHTALQKLARGQNDGKMLIKVLHEAPKL